MLVDQLIECINTEFVVEKKEKWPHKPIRPPLNKKVFPVDRPSGFKRADWNFFFYIF